MPNLTLKNIANVCETMQSKAPGAFDELYWAPICDFLAAQDYDTTITDIDNFGLVTVAHTFTAPKGFVKILDLQENTCKFTSEPQGEDGYGNFKVAAEAMTRGQNPKFQGFLNQERFRRGIALVKLRNGNVMQIGSESFPAFISGGSFDSQTNKSTDKFGIQFKIEAVQPIVMRYNYPTLAITIVT